MSHTLFGYDPQLLLVLTLTVIQASSLTRSAWERLRRYRCRRQKLEASVQPPAEVLLIRAETHEASALVAREARRRLAQAAELEPDHRRGRN